MRDEYKIKAAAALKHDVEAGLKDLDSGRFEVYDDANLIDLANEVCFSGRKRLNATMEADPTKAYNQGRRHRFHPAQRAALESRGEGAEEKKVRGLNG